MSADPLLEVSHLTVNLTTEDGLSFDAVSDVSFSLAHGETLCLVGESGCGKSMTASAIMRLLPEIARITQGSVSFEGDNLGLLSQRGMAEIRGRRIGMVFQEPMTSLNPVLKVGDQVAEVLVRHAGMDRRRARMEAAQLFRRVGIPEAERRLDDYPHQLSGGLRQRVMIATALACSPALLIADEPTTALDVTVQKQILVLLRDLVAEQGMGLLLITHDLGVVAQMATHVGVMYAGRLVEYGSVASVLGTPLHPYTQGLIMAAPRLTEERSRRLPTIPGSVPSPVELTGMGGCPFRPRCAVAQAMCGHMPHMRNIGGRSVSCWHCSPQKDAEDRA